MTRLSAAIEAANSAVRQMTVGEMQTLQRLTAGSPERLRQQSLWFAMPQRYSAYAVSGTMAVTLSATG